MEAVGVGKIGNLSASLPPVVRALLAKRGYESDEAISAFLNPKYEGNLADPYLMKDMKKAIDRLLVAKKRSETVAVYGDYDIDGVAATALILEVLEANNIDAFAYIPDRYEEGYGLNTEALGAIKKRGASLVVTVDCGITSADEVAWANKKGLDVIITDHHEVPEVVPEAVAVVNPRQPSDKYPYKELAGVGVAFAVARALQQATGQPAEGQEKWLLDLVALGTVCDVMPLTGENRIMAKFGLLVLSKTKRVGLVALAQSAGLVLTDVRPYHLGFVIGPRLNAAGRLEHAAHSLDLIATKDPVLAQKLAYSLEELNHKRRIEQSRITAEADAAAQEFSEDPILVLADPSWSHGVVGIVASKLAEKWQKPTLILQVLGDLAKGSGRSANGYNLIDGLQSAQDIFEKLGGHHFAAGFTLPAARINDLRQLLAAHYRQVESTLPPPANREADLQLEDISEVNWQLYDALQALEPYGHGNPQPVLGIDGAKIIDVTVIGQKKEHLKLRITGKSGSIYEALAFNQAEKYAHLRSGQLVNITFFIEKNQYNERSQLQLVLVAVQ
ncbi:MAG TPA: single-stranded-DNA-specific exonuclease RecJ [Candidatus Dormibacteraeota bacterium]|nr:single-stranded-DNA-specific exonuclease RecJ [Candidatus Dormibacteraeota bacterium]